MSREAKVCIHCCKPIEMHNRIYDNAKNTDHYRTVCRPCKNVAQIKQRAARARRDAEASAPAERTPDTVPPRQHIGVGTYSPAADRTFYRNDGLKHIQSRGNPT